ncbi:hypothetical protein [Castellaniella caeni]|uniref:hypothetical protein n=1 Tax=Castellaniella caeni TaxID=266123 RepID=UPI000C9F7F75|nr:hypothetical protein [Castellaniella caeni]
MSYVAVAGAVVAALGAVAQNQAQQDAARRQQRSIQAELQRQQSFQRQAEQEALKRVDDYQPEARADRQKQIEQQATETLMQPVQDALPAMQDQSAVQGNVSSDYTAARAKSQADQMTAANELARIMGKITGAGRLRQDEAMKMLSTGQNIDMLKNFASGSQGVGQLESQTAGVPDGGMMLAGSLMQTLGSVGLAKGLSAAGSAGKATIGTPWSNTGATAQTSAVWSPSPVQLFPVR